MGNCTSHSDRAAKAHSDAIDKDIENDSKKFRKECKILLLGASIPSIMGGRWAFVTCSRYNTYVVARGLTNRPPSNWR